MINETAEPIYMISDRSKYRSSAIVPRTKLSVITILDRLRKRGGVFLALCIKPPAVPGPDRASVLPFLVFVTWTITKFFHPYTG